MSLSLVSFSPAPAPAPTPRFVLEQLAHLASEASVYPGPLATLLAAESDLTVEEVRVGLLCPLSLRRIQDLPLRGRGCTHYETFEGKTFLTLLAGSSGADAPCPHCRNRLRVADLVKCGFTLGVLRSEKLPRDATHILVKRDLTWEAEPPRKRPNEVFDTVEEEPACAGSNSGSSQPAAVAQVGHLFATASAPDTPAKDLKRAKELVQRCVVSRPNGSRGHRTHPYTRSGTNDKSSNTVWQETQYLQTRHSDYDHDHEFDYDHDQDYDHEHDQDYDHEHDQDYDHEHDQDYDHEHDQDYDHEESYPEDYEESNWMDSWEEELPGQTGSAFSWSRGLQSLFG